MGTVVKIGIQILDLFLFSYLQLAAIVLPTTHLQDKWKL